MKHLLRGLILILLVLVIVGVPAASAQDVSRVPGYFQSQFRSMAAAAGLQTNSVISPGQTSLAVAADFAIGADIISTAPMGTNLTVRLTNLVQGATIGAFLTGGTNGATYTVTVSTNGINGVAVRWGWDSPTNGASSFTLTNGMRVEASFKAVSSNEVWARWSVVR